MRTREDAEEAREDPEVETEVKNEINRGSPASTAEERGMQGRRLLES